MSLEIEDPPRTRHGAITRLAWLCAGDLTDSEINRLVRLAAAMTDPREATRNALLSIIGQAIDLL